MFDDLFEALWLAGLVVGSAIRARHGRRYRRERGVVQQRWESPVDRILTMSVSLGFLLPLVHIFSPWLAFADYRLPGWAGWGGVGLYAGGLWLLWRSHVELRGNWSPWLETREEQGLITQGVFAHVRHPMYGAHVLWGLAQPLLIGNWIAGFAMLATVLPVVAYRVPREERMLTQHFGDAYRAYAARTGAIVPCLPSSRR
jgi:protein-S-isoprenylcysteine O-methyltransferase Ste14